ncbi:peptide chain release factor 1-like, mitochondrial [Tubulanus polymorphus]|uniref:peptide chain release factor 1-like, mitochondrial n=1 Tax=Tubulanus polymorphus TaxID=672921 RepID=UPI003DA50C9A
MLTVKSRILSRLVSCRPVVRGGPNEHRFISQSTVGCKFTSRQTRILNSECSYFSSVSIHNHRFIVKASCIDLSRQPARYYSIAERFSFDRNPLKTYVRRLMDEYSALTRKMKRLDSYGDREQTELCERHADVHPIAERVIALEKRRSDIQEISKMMEDLTSPEDDEMMESAREEIDQLEKQCDQLKHEVLLMLVPPSRLDESDIVLEVSAGVGGKEAMIFTGELFEMYQQLAAWRKWAVDVIDYDRTELGGVRKASCVIRGRGVYKYLKYESGIHRVQRVPVTERTSRLHTSTAAVAVLPTPTEIDVVLNPRDLKIDTFRASGKGGQHINTTDSAVRITHVPTNTVVECQTERSQIKNRATAMNVLRSRIYRTQLERAERERRSQRKLQIGSVDRSDKIRTYNYPQDRITDHRIGETVYNVREFLNGGESLNAMIDVLHEESKAEVLLERLEDIVEENETKS